MGIDVRTSFDPLERGCVKLRDIIDPENHYAHFEEEELDFPRSSSKEPQEEPPNSTMVSNQEDHPHQMVEIPIPRSIQVSYPKSRRYYHRRKLRIAG